jgi:hypothetical protein
VSVALKRRLTAHYQVTDARDHDKLDVVCTERGWHGRAYVQMPSSAAGAGVHRGRPHAAGEIAPRESPLRIGTEILFGNFRVARKVRRLLQDAPELQAGQDDEYSKVNDPVSLLTLYASQFGSYTTLLWQVPALSLTAQLFLMTIALGSGSKAARLITSALSMIIAWASTRLMHDQRGHAINHGELARRISKQLHLARHLGEL